MLKRTWVYSEYVTCTEEKRNVIRIVVGSLRRADSVEELGVERTQIGV